MENKKEYILVVGITKEDSTELTMSDVDSFYGEFIELVEKHNFLAAGAFVPSNEKSNE